MCLNPADSGTFEWRGICSIAQFFKGAFAFLDVLLITIGARNLSRHECERLGASVNSAAFGRMFPPDNCRACLP
jgi:hypothetical protein